MIARRALPVVAGALAFCVAVALALTVNGYWVFVIATFAITALAGVGLNVLIGLTGRVSFGHAGFCALGAYAAAILMTRYGWPLPLVLPVAAMLAAVAGFLLAIPALRVRGPYLAMVTIAFGLIVENLIVEMRSVTGGQNGIMGIPGLTMAGRSYGERGIAVLSLLLLAAGLWAYARLAEGPWGHAMRAVRDSDVAAESIGIDPLRVRVVAFAVSAFFAGLAGALTAPLSGFVTPSSFHFGQSILFVLVVLLGGSGRTAGPVWGALVVVLLPEMLSGLAEYRLLIFGALLLLVLWIAPEGVAGLLPRANARRAAKEPATAQGETAFDARPRRLLEARGLSIAFGGVRALTDLDFDARPGRIHALIGPNGAGKTTALNLLTGYYVPDRGRMLLGGAALPAGSGWRIARAGIARTYQTTRLFGSLSVEANVALALLRGRLGALFAAGAMRTPVLKARVHGLLQLVGYAQSPNVPARELSLVDQRLVEIARALAIDPDTVFLDEPAAGLSRADKARLAILLRSVAAAGVAVVLVEHDMGLVMDCADEITVLESGVRIAHGTPAEVRADVRVRRSYLGEGAGHAPGARARVEGAVLLETLALEAGYGGHPVLRGIDVRVREKEAIAVLGANGAGKSTFMRAIAGLHRPVHGQVVVAGESLDRLAAHRVVQRGVVLVPEGRQVFPDLTVLDNLRLGAYRRRHDAADIEGVVARFPKLRDRLRQRAGSLSGGEQQMLAVARGLMAAPRVLLLDEPSLGLAPRIVAELFQSLEALRRGGLTLVVVDQVAPMALALCDRVYVLEGGGVGFTGSAGEVAGNAALERAYLGADASLIELR